MPLKLASRQPYPVPDDRTGTALEDAIAVLSGATVHGQQALFAEATALFRRIFSSATVQILVRAGGQWRSWDVIDDNVERIDAVLAGFAEQACVQSVFTNDDLTVASVETGSVVVVVGEGRLGPARQCLLRTVCQLLRMAIDSCESRLGNSDRLEAIRVFQRVADRILKSQNLQEVSLQITHEAKTRLSADISGIMLLEGD